MLGSSQVGDMMIKVMDNTLMARKRKGRRFTSVTACDARFTLLFVRKKRNHLNLSDSLVTGRLGKGAPFSRFMTAIIASTCVDLGLTTQSVNICKRLKLQSRDKAQAAQILQGALTLKRLGLKSFYWNRFQEHLQRKSQTL